MNAIFTCKSILVFIALICFFPINAAGQKLMYECKKTHLIGDKILDFARDKMTLEIDLSRPALSLSTKNWLSMTGKNTVHSDAKREDDGISFVADVVYSWPTIRADNLLFGVYGGISFNFETNVLSFSPKFDMPWECTAR